MDINGLGAKTIHKLVDNGWIVIVADIFRLTVDDICSLEGYSKISSEKLLFAMNEAKVDRSLHRVIVELGLPGLGKIGSEEFAKKIESLDNLVSIEQKVHDNTTRSSRLNNSNHS